MSRDLNPYDVLGVHPDATPGEIRSAFRHKALLRHPDTTQDPSGRPHVADVVAAYRMLIDPASRAGFDSGHPRTSGRRIEVHHGRAPTRNWTSSDARCVHCRGRGVVASTRFCPTCGGQGEVTLLGLDRSGVVFCRTCGGQGSFVRTQRCPHCHGTGLS